ncbi:hypothetical protein HPS8415995_1379 [Glaesserella parasuis 84-15995]|nr:hypothetical protein HPSNAG_1228 [Glaesserella parasuis str. Nagasaki]EQA08634.1 hypothetical protein HPS8415995_1379 [Glaesserella parasuis 84-15995]
MWGLVKFRGNLTACKKRFEWFNLMKEILFYKNQIVMSKQQ